MQDRRTLHTSKTRTTIYLDGLQLGRQRAEELHAAGFDVILDRRRKLPLELVVMAKADMLIVGPEMSPESWMKVGYSLAAGMVAIGIGLPANACFGMQVDTWYDLSRNCFLAIGDGDFKKPMRTLGK